MADVELVIKIPKELYEAYKVFGGTEMDKIAQLIANGIPLPKGHGKLIDVNDLLEQICLEDTKENRKLNLGEIITLEDIDRINPIIEADKSEGSER